MKSAGAGCEPKLARIRTGSGRNRPRVGRTRNGLLSRPALPAGHSRPQRDSVPRTPERVCVLLVCGIVLAQFSAAHGLPAPHPRSVSSSRDRNSERRRPAHWFSSTNCTAMPPPIKEGSLSNLARANGFQQRGSRVPHQSYRLVEKFPRRGASAAPNCTSDRPQRDYDSQTPASPGLTSGPAHPATA